MKSWIVLIVATVALGASVLVFSWRHFSTPSRSKAGVPAKQAGDAEDLVELRREVDGLKRAIRPQLYVVAPGAKGSAPDHDEDPQREAQRSEEQLKAAATALDKRHASEGADILWSQRTAGEVRQAIAAKDPGAKLLSADCTSSLCRVVVSHASEPSQGELSDTLADVQAGLVSMFFRYELDGSSRKTTIYLLRNGQDFRAEMNAL